MSKLYDSQKEPKDEECICFICGGKKLRIQLYCDQCFESREVCPKCKRFKLTNHSLCQNCEDDD